MRARRIVRAAVLVAVLAGAAAAWAGGKPGRHEKEHPQTGVDAYAYVLPGEVSLDVSPVLVAARTRNVVRVSSPAPGVYCLTPTPQVDAGTTSWTATPEAARSTAPSRAMFAYADAGGQPCSSQQIAVRTYELSPPGTAAIPSERVAFMVVTG